MSCAKADTAMAQRFRWQNINTALNRLERDAKYAIHGLRRDVFLFRHVSNLEQVCATGAMPEPITCKAEELGLYWRQRWVVPRSIRDQSWKTVDTLQVITSLIGGA